MCTSFIVQVRKSAQQLSRRDVTFRRSAFALSHRFVLTLNGVIRWDARRRYLVFFSFNFFVVVVVVGVSQISAFFSNGSISHRRTHLFSAHFFFSLFYLFNLIGVCFGCSKFGHCIGHIP